MTDKTVKNLQGASAIIAIAGGAIGLTMGIVQAVDYFKAKKVMAKQIEEGADPAK